MKDQELQKLRDALTASKETTQGLLTEITEAEKSLAELDKPKLEHGDFGVRESGEGRLVCRLKGIDEKKPLSSIQDGNWSYTSFRPPESIFGNVFDLCKRYAGKFKGYKTKSAYGTPIEIAINHDIKLRVDGNVFQLTPAIAKELGHQCIHAALDCEREE